MDCDYIMKRLIGKRVLIKFNIEEPKIKAKIIDITTEGLFCEQNTMVSFYFHRDIKEIIILPLDDWTKRRVS